MFVPSVLRKYLPASSAVNASAPSESSYVLSPVNSAVIESLKSAVISSADVLSPLICELPSNSVRWLRTYVLPAPRSTVPVNLISCPSV